MGTILKAQPKVQNLTFTVPPPSPPNPIPPNLTFKLLPCIVLCTADGKQPLAHNGSNWSDAYTLHQQSESVRPVYVRSLKIHDNTRSPLVFCLFRHSLRLQWCKEAFWQHHNAFQDFDFDTGTNSINNKYVKKKKKISNPFTIYKTKRERETDTKF